MVKTNQAQEAYDTKEQAVGPDDLSAQIIVNAIKAYINDMTISNKPRRNVIRLFERNTIRRCLNWWSDHIFCIIWRKRWGRPSVYIFTPKYHYEVSLFKIHRWERETRLRPQRLCSAKVTSMIGFNGREIALSSPNAKPWFCVHYTCSNSRAHAWEVDGHINIATDRKRWYDLDASHNSYDSIILTKKDQKVINNAISKYISDVINA